MSLTDYTTYADVRAALGVSDDELKDEQLALVSYLDALLSDFEDIALNFQSVLDTTLAVSTPTEAQSRFLRYARLFSTYATARTLLGSLPMFGPKSVTDGKAGFERFTDPYRDTIREVNAQYGKWRERVVAAFEALGEAGTVSTSRTYLSVISPSSDPVTGT